MDKKLPPNGSTGLPVLNVRTKEELRQELARRAGGTATELKLTSCARPKLLRMHLPCDKKGNRGTFVRGEEIQVHHRDSDPDHPNYYKGIILDFVLEGNILILVTKETIKYEGEKTLNVGVYRQPLDEPESRKLWYITRVERTPPPQPQQRQQQAA